MSAHSDEFIASVSGVSIEKVRIILRLAEERQNDLHEALLEAFGGDDVAAIRRAFDKGMNALTELDVLRQSAS